LAAEIQFALGLAILRMPMLPDQVDRSQAELVRSAGEIAELLEQSKYDAAYPKLQDLLRRYPATPYLHYVYGTALASFSRYDEAEAQFREELKISPKSELPLIGLASVLLQARRESEALPFARRAAEMAPGSANAHYLLGRALLETDGAEAAIPELVKAKELSPRSAEVHFALARAYAKADQQEKAEAERTIFVRLKSEAEERKNVRSGPAVGGFQRQAEPAAVENGGAARP
jgi:predicted Zn-dependent protease